MRKLTGASDASLAKRICDHLLIAGIDSEARTSGGQHEVWVMDHDDLGRARELLSAGEHADWADVARRADLIRNEKQRADKLDAKRKEGVPKDRLSQDNGPRPLTSSMILLSALVGWMSDFGDLKTPIVDNLLIQSRAGPYPSLLEALQQQPYRVLTPMFVHFGIVHLAFNMLWIFNLGHQVERRHGAFALLGIVLLASAPANLLQYTFSGPLFGGMSGVVYALFGFVWMQARYGRKYGYLLRADHVWIMMLWFVVCATGLVGPVANAAHAVGFAVGLFVGLPAYLRRFGDLREGRKIREGSWTDVNLVGFRRFTHRYVTPYAPFWFLLLAMLVLLTER